MEAWYFDPADRGIGPFGNEIRMMIKHTCQNCIHFVDDPAVIEAEIPGLTSFGSAYSSARGYAGICREFYRFLDPEAAYNCPSFEVSEMNAVTQNNCRPDDLRQSFPKE